jgi:hypothetical protein
MCSHGPGTAHVCSCPELRVHKASDVFGAVGRRSMWVRSCTHPINRRPQPLRHHRPPLRVHAAQVTPGCARSPCNACTAYIYQRIAHREVRPLKWIISVSRAHRHLRNFNARRQRTRRAVVAAESVNAETDASTQIAVGGWSPPVPLALPIKSWNPATL